MKMKKMSFLAAIVAAGGLSAADIELPKPETQGGMPLQEALQSRRTGRSFSDRRCRVRSCRTCSGPPSA